NDLINAIARLDSNNIEPHLLIYTDRLTDVKTGKTISTISARQTLITSQHKQILGIFSPETGSLNSTEPRKNKFITYSSNDHPDYVIQNQYVDTGKRPVFFLNEAKKAALQISPNGDRAKFYDNHGRLLREKIFSQNLPHNYETPLTVFSADGNRLAFFTRIFNMEDNQMIPMLYLLSPIGEEIWKAQLILKRFDNLEISESGQSVVAAGQTFQPVGSQTQNHIFVFDSIGVIQNSLPYRAIQTAFNPAENQLLIRDEQTVKIIDLNSEGIVISIKIGRGRREIADMCYLNDSTFIVSTGTVKFTNGVRIYDSPEIRLYSISGSLLATADFPDTYSHLATIVKSFSGNRIGFCLQNKFIVLQVTQKD
ncbi:MAG: hypothetical protein JXR87_00455, partial [Candidatus Marinimicrobia bacterium]|nr:hypothetical protein [Candidatus Neomarinimicrobiota bacterium]